MAKNTDPTAHTPETSKTSRPHRGLGRGIGALFPQSQSEDVASVSRPLDVFFPERRGGSAPVRGGSQRDLLSPTAMKRQGNAKRQGSSEERSTKKTASVSSRTKSEKAAPARSVHKNSSGSADVPATAPKKKAATTDTTSASVLASTPSQGRTRTERTAKKHQLFSDVLEKAHSNVSRETLDDDSHAASTAPTDHAAVTDSATLTDTSAVAGTATITGRAAQSTTSGRDEAELLEVPGASFAEIPTEWIVPNTRQPRSVFDEDELNELSDSIKEVGILQPIVVRPIEIADATSKTLRGYLEEKPEARYELIMGERRLRASELAGIDTIPAIIRRTQDEDLLRDALLENLHRAQLNPLEEASAYAQLMEDFGATQEELSRKIARSRPQIANTLRLLKLPPTVQRKVASGVISAGHARALLSLPSAHDMELLADRIVAEGLSVRTTEEIARLNKPQPTRTSRRRSHKPVSELGRHVAEQLSDLCETRVSVSEGVSKGKIVIEFAGPEDLERIARVLKARP